MAVSARAYVLAALAVAAALGLALGAETQAETFLRPEPLRDGGTQDVASNLVTLTALLPALALAAAAAVLSRAPWQRRLPASAMLGVAVLVLVWMVQSAWPNYDVVEESRSAQFSITPLISNGPAVGSVFLGPMAILLAAAFLLQQAGRWLLPATPREQGPHELLRSTLAAYLTSAPFLLVLVIGGLRLLLGLPDEEARTVPYQIVFPLASLAALGLLVTGAVKTWHVGAFARNGLLADAAQDAWNGLRRAEWALAAVLGALAFLATLLPAVPSDLLEAGRTFGLTTRGHVQAQVLLAVPVLPWMALHDPVVRAMQAHGGHSANLESGTHPLVIGSWVALGLATLGGGLAAWLLDGALWTWALVLAPLVVYGWTVLDARQAMWPALLLAVVLWGIGNTVVGSFSLRTDVDVNLQTPPGVLALFRILAVIVVAVTFGRLARTDARGLRPATAWPMAILVAAALALVLFLELPFGAWKATDIDGEFVGIGSVVSSQDPSVRTTIHVLASLAAGAAAFAVARIHRPDWFQRPPPLPSLDKVAQPAS